MLAQDIASRLMARRKAAHIPRKTVAFDIGITEGALTKWERGERVPSLPNVVAWARALGAEIEMTGA